MLDSLRVADTTPRGTPGLQRLPYELMSYVARDLTLEEIFDLALCSHHFLYLIREENFCKSLIKAKAPCSWEAVEAGESGCYSRALRRLMKRRRAVSNASPYLAGIIGLADSYELSDGTLCYIVEDRPERRLRILDLRGNTNFEVVVDIPTLVSEAVPKSTGLKKYTFRVLHHADGITSCLYSFAKPTTDKWLLIFNAKEHRILGKLPLDSAARIFVRNNGNFLYYGTHSEYDTDGFRKWVLRGFDLRSCELIGQKIQLSNVVGYDVGSTVCFEVIDDYFYGLSNQTAFEIEEIDWTSYYYCFRFQVEDPDHKKIQVMRKRDSWRRQHAEGPIDDRWGFMRLEKDEATGAIRILESRKEWLAGQSGHRRTYYFKDVVFDGSTAEKDADADDDELPDDPLTDLLGSSSRPSYMLPQQRLPEEFHRGDDGATMFTRSNTYLRSYYHSCNTFLDLVDDPPPFSPDKQRLRLRTGCRTISQPSGGRDMRSNTVEEGEPRRYNMISPTEKHPGFWPVEQDPQQPNPQLDALYRVLNPPGYLGNVIATGDDRSIVYSTGAEAGGLKALVYLSFDPAAKLTRMMYGGGSGGTANRGSQRETEDTTVKIKGKGKEICITTQVGMHAEAGQEGKNSIPSCSSVANFTSLTDNLVLSAHTLPGPDTGNSWARIEKAFHHDLPWKYTFAF